MPYQEKIAWLSLVAMAVTYGPYFAIAGSDTDGGPGLRLLLLFGIAASTHAVLTGIGRWYLRRKAPLDARTPPDERDRAIDRRSVAFAYGVLMAGMILVGVVMPFNSGGWAITNAALFSLIVAEVVRDASTVTSYRMQS